MRRHAATPPSLSPHRVAASPIAGALAKPEDTMKTLAAAALIAAASIAPAGAAGSSSPASAFAYFAGNWTCAVSMTSDPDRTYPMTFTIAPAPGGLEMQTWTGPAASGVNVVTYDPIKKQYALVGVTSSGDRGASVSSGWNGTRLVWKAVSAAGPDDAVGIQTVTKQSATKWSYVYKAQNYSETVTCTKN
jgi:hypothetical protein